ncbi:MAG: LacI family DNA-binding transcriptional regulator [Rhodobacteraceae bacterium]|nr:LacI family DNA-binding transcriptional regulator [Paracoccaceae bacterium]
MPKPTYRDIARRAGTGTATVERVLNGRGGVRPQTAMRVVAAARALDWPGRLPERHRGILRIEVLLVRPDSSFFSRLARSFRRIAATLDPTVQVHVTFLDEGDGPAIARRIARPEAPRAGLIVACPGFPAVREALGEAVARGLPVIQVVTEILPGAPFVGIDNRAAGRTAALFLSRMCQRDGPVIALCHGNVYQVHRERLHGFTDHFALHPAPRLPFVWAAFGRDERDLSVRRLREALREWPDLAGLYNAGGANSAILEALAHHPRHVFFVGHELSPATEAALRAGTADIVLDQVPEAQARRTLDLMLARLGLTGMAIDNPPIRFTTITAENL